MASKSKKSESRERHRLPLEQQRELNNDGRCRRILCDILRLRVLAYIARQPTPFMFILSLFLISITLPLVGLYISRVDGLPDLDAMQVCTCMLNYIFNPSCTVWSGWSICPYVDPVLVSSRPFVQLWDMGVKLRDQSYFNATIDYNNTVGLVLNA